MTGNKMLCLRVNHGAWVCKASGKAHQTGTAVEFNRLYGCPSPTVRFAIALIKQACSAPIASPGSWVLGVFYKSNYLKNSSFRRTIAFLTTSVVASFSVAVSLLHLPPKTAVFT